LARLLLDTHALLWWSTDDAALASAASAAIGDPANEIFVSAASAWEIATKFRIGKLPDAEILALDIASAIANQGFLELPITIAHAQRAGGLPEPIRDPFDRILIAQSILETMPLISNEGAFDRYGIARLW
jgi:PIN domain nuclease of toxin-antitoxin system